MADETREEVRDDATEETNTEEVEQREDDYQGLARRLEDIMKRLDAIEDKQGEILGMFDNVADNGAVITAAAEEVADAVADVIDIYDFDNMDFVI